MFISMIRSSTYLQHEQYFNVYRFNIEESLRIE